MTDRSHIGRLSAPVNRPTTSPASPTHSPPTSSPSSTILSHTTSSIPDLKDGGGETDRRQRNGTEKRRKRLKERERKTGGRFCYPAVFAFDRRFSDDDALKVSNGGSIGRERGGTEVTVRWSPSRTGGHRLGSVGSFIRWFLLLSDGSLFGSSGLGQI
ncbi:hypothetical protein Hanom_Chr00s178976g01831391 [Helianthus anomalus]